MLSMFQERVKELTLGNVSPDEIANGMPCHQLVLVTALSKICSGEESFPSDLVIYVPSSYPRLTVHKRAQSPNQVTINTSILRVRISHVIRLVRCQSRSIK